MCMQWAAAWPSTSPPPRARRLPRTDGRPRHRASAGPARCRPQPPAPSPASTSPTPNPPDWPTSTPWPSPPPPARRVRRASASPLFTPHSTYRASQNGPRCPGVGGRGRLAARGGRHTAAQPHGHHPAPGRRPGPARGRHTTVRTRPLPRTSLAHLSSLVAASPFQPFVRRAGPWQLIFAKAAGRHHSFGKTER
ncbi:hypothetical protein DDV98_27660 [Streptomyces sp. IB2014 011-12]|nr:hypothetical protein DDV98_27660 [Streptomyces sp. IB2014 011-12]